jgi:monoamine oxidase
LAGVTDVNKVLVEFDAAFWSDEFGMFLVAAESEKERGNLQTWYNIHKLLGKPVLMGFLSGTLAKEFESFSDAQAREVGKTLKKEKQKLHS